ncbi:amino acid/amide ABC transporter substrate-binding protein (HAAT family) [Aliiruegeria haliotis]|uniref:Amino acid/amide ABC transporter substrate-binding protein (HAAT family) n=1 Tax=Aliiruegeria haliotis TaxID=1280846 RepID=A0A2T0RWI8_9RHOB|nr:ABC transporter substrate-binding protein [Aliiruegeria haliotis]PRY25555.1 amino acid/amide ABC transporter substrate-binding protein (HAAT family) [Aliiruegeria haliotis]
MFSAFRNPFALATRGLALAGALLLAACDGVPNASGGGGPSIDTSAPVPVALLVPGGAGGDAIVSQSLENAARLAIADLDKVQIDLRVYQTGGNAGGASAAASRAADEGAKIILGPLYSEAANAAGLAVANRGLNVLAFSNNASIAGGNVFVLGNLFQNTSDRLTRYAASRGKGNIFVVNARTTAEEIGRDAILNSINSSRANLAGSASFDFSQQGIVAAVPQISQQVQASGANSVFFTSDNDGAMSFLAQMLPENGVGAPNHQFIGLARLDIPPEALSQPGLQGAWMALPDPGLSANFRSRYASAYGGAPHPLAGLSYDGIAAVGALVGKGKSDALTRAALTQGSGFVGVNGIFRLLPDGTNQRGLAVGQIQNSQVTVIDAAPRSFGGFGF